MSLPEQPAAATRYRIKLTSRRTGKVGWLDEHGMTTEHESCAGRFYSQQAAALAFEFREALEQVTGACRWAVEIVP